MTILEVDSAPVVGASLILLSVAITVVQRYRRAGESQRLGQVGHMSANLDLGIL